jgi:hypothetical protein
MTMPTTNYTVSVQLDASGEIALCQYADASGKPAQSPLKVPMGNSCTFVQAPGQALVLVGVVFKTVGHAPVLTANNFAPAVNGSVTVTMPAAEVVTKGAILLFADPGKVSSLYPTSDPEIVNG